MENNKKVLLSISDLHVKFRVRGRILTAIRGISLDIYENESIAIVGESGSGKSATAYSIMQMLLGFNTVSSFFLPGDSQMLWWRAILVCLIDYVIAYTVLGLGGIFRNKFSTKKALVLGSVFAISLRYVAHIVSGAIFFGAWAEWFFTQEGFYAWGQSILDTFSGNSLALVYSIIYNGTYMIPEIVITAIVAFFIARIPQIKIVHPNK